MDLADADNPARVVPTHVFCCQSGLIGVLAPLTKAKHDFLAALQNVLCSVLQTVGGFSHADWRAVKTDARTEAAANFIDGDLIESLLEMPPPMQATVAAKMHPPQDVTELIKIVTTLTRIH
jgi:DNA damage-binding protein 1